MASTMLKADDVWKYGTSYELATLNVFMDPQATGTNAQVLVAEKLQLIDYAITNGSLPPGNKIFK